MNKNTHSYLLHICEGTEIFWCVGHKHHSFMYNRRLQLQNRVEGLGCYICFVVESQAVVSSGASLLTLLICDSLCFVLEVARIALFEAPLLPFSFNLRTQWKDKMFHQKWPEEARRLHSGSHRQSPQSREAFDSRPGDKSMNIMLV